MDYYHNNSYNRAHSDNASVTKNAIKKKATKSAVAAPVKLSTDPQSVAARERRHRISEKFKTLQSLVPGGAKMDTVSMLDEAIHYVKFLKTQIWLHEALISGDQCISEYDHQSFNKSVPAADAYSDQSFQPQQQELQCCSESCFEWSHECCLSSVDAAASGGQSSWVFDMPEVQFASEMTMF